MTRLWVRLVRGHRIWKQETFACGFSEAQEALTEICREMDIPRPMWFPKQEKEFEAFRLTSFSSDNFLESIPFDKMEIEFLEDGPARRSRDPRNDFS